MGTVWVTTAICSLLGNELVANGAGQTVLNSYTDLLLQRGDYERRRHDGCGRHGGALCQLRHDEWLTDLNVDGAVDIGDVKTMVTQVFRTVAGDFNLDGKVDGADYVLWRKKRGHRERRNFMQGDATFDGDDRTTTTCQVWRANFGFARQPLSAGSGSGVSRWRCRSRAAVWMFVGCDSMVL